MLKERIWVFYVLVILASLAWWNAPFSAGTEEGPWGVRDEPVRVAERSCGAGRCPRNCKIAVVSTFPPKLCGVAEYSKHMVDSLVKSERFVHDACEIEIFAIIREDDTHLETNSQYKVHPVLFENHVTSNGPYNISTMINENGFAHCILHCEYGLTPTMWHMTDVLRFLKPEIIVTTILHSPTSYVSSEVHEFARQLYALSDYLCTMTWYGYHTLLHEYGIPQRKLRFVPHGVTLHPERKRSATFKHPRIKHDDLVVITYGLIHQCKGFHRLFNSLTQIREAVPNIKIVILGTANKYNWGLQYMNSLVERITHHMDIVIWENRFMNRDELKKWFSRADLFFNLMDEITPTSGTLLEAMAWGMPIISTPYRFAQELLVDGRGLLVPYENTTVLANTFIRVLQDEALRKQMGEAAILAVKNWEWGLAAHNFMGLINGEPDWAPLSPSPFRDDASNVPLKTMVGVFFDVIAFVDGTKKMCPNQGTYVLYVDPTVQVNVYIVNRVVVAVGIKSPRRILWIKKDFAVDEMLIDAAEEAPEDQMFTYGNELGQELSYKSVNIDFTVNNFARKDVLEIRFTRINRFTHAMGIIGSGLQCFLSNSMTNICSTGCEYTLNMDDWVVLEGNVFGRSRKQLWRWACYWSDTFHTPRNRLPRETRHGKLLDSQRINLTIIGPIFGHSGFASVNREMALRLYHSGNFKIQFQVQDESEGKDKFASLRTHFLHFMIEESKINQQIAECPQEQFNSGYEVHFRNQWPPSPDPPPPYAVLIVQQPWEFGGFPVAWESFLRYTDELWVPSEYCRTKYVQDGIPPNRITKVLHGLNLKLDPSLRQPDGRLNFLILGSLVPRKGVEAMLVAFHAVFLGDPTVRLTVHSNVWDDPVKNRVTHLAGRMANVKLDFVDKSDTEIAALVKNTDVLLAVYKSEGFGLSIPSAMAVGVVPVVPKYGPALEYCGEGCYFVEGREVPCREPPCGDMTMFGMEATSQPVWFDVDLNDLKATLRRIRDDRKELERRRAAALESARHVTSWQTVMQQVEARMRALLKSKFPNSAP